MKVEVAVPVPNSPYDFCSYTTLYHWRELPQISFLPRHLSRQTPVCGDKYVFVRTKHIICRDKSMFVATNISTKMMLVTAPANDNFELEHSACGLNREEQLGSHSELDSRLLQVSTVGFFDTVFVTVSPTTVERASCKAHKLLLCLRGPHHLNCLLWQSDISCFYGSERLGRATGQPSPPRPLPLPHPPLPPPTHLFCP